MAMLKSSMINAGIDFTKGSLTFKCIKTAPAINMEMTKAAGKTTIGSQSPKRSKRAELILRNPIT